MLHRDDNCKNEVMKTSIELEYNLLYRLLSGFIIERNGLLLRRPNKWPSDCAMCLVLPNSESQVRRTCGQNIGKFYVYKFHIFFTKNHS